MATSPGDTLPAVCRAPAVAGDRCRRAFLLDNEQLYPHGDLLDVMADVSIREEVYDTFADAGDEVEIRVRDDGRGIEEMEAAVIADGTETPLEHGAGLGLWMVNWIVTRYGGSFQVATGDDGTVATVRLPAIGPGETVETATRRPTVLFR